MMMHPKQKIAFELAMREIGLKELAGPLHEARIVAFFAEVGHPWVKDDETAWCAAFVGAMLERAGLESTRKLNARSYLEWGSPVELKDLQPGDVLIFKRGKVEWQGHVAFADGTYGATKINALSGNQRNRVGVDPYPIGDLLGIRRMEAPANPRQAPANPLASLIALLGRLFGGTRKLAST